MSKDLIQTTENNSKLPEDPRSRSFKILIRQEDGDPRGGEGIRFVNENLDAITSTIMKNERLWTWIKEHPEQHIVYYKIDMGELMIDVVIDFRDHKYPCISMLVMNTEWMHQQKGEIKRIFPEESDNRSGTQEVVKRLSIVPRKDLQIIDTSFDPDNIKDRLGKGLDVQIIELIRILNMTGIKTDMSCAGHPKSGNSKARLPFLSIEWNSFSHFMSAISDWEEAKNLIFYPVGLSSVRCTFPEGTPLKKAQRTFGELTDFLAKKIDNKHESTLNPVEIQQRLRRQKRKEFLIHAS